MVEISRFLSRVGLDTLCTSGDHLHGLSRTQSLQRRRASRPNLSHRMSARRRHRISCIGYQVAHRPPRVPRNSPWTSYGSWGARMGVTLGSSRTLNPQRVASDLLADVLLAVAQVSQTSDSARSAGSRNGYQRAGLQTSRIEQLGGIERFAPGHPPEADQEFAHQRHHSLALELAAVTLEFLLVPSPSPRVLLNPAQHRQVEVLPHLARPPLGDPQLPLAPTTADLLQVQTRCLQQAARAGVARQRTETAGQHGRRRPPHDLAHPRQGLWRARATAWSLRASAWSG